MAEPRRRPSAVAFLEAAWVVAFLVVAVLWWRGGRGPGLDARLPPLAPESLAEGESESWMGVYLEDTKMGWSMSRELPLEDGVRIREQSYLRLTAFGQERDISTLSEVELDDQERARQVRFVLDASPARLEVEADPVGDGLAVVVRQGGNVIQEMTLDERPVLPSAMWRILARQGIEPGVTRTVQLFDVTLLSDIEVTVEFGDSVEFEGGRAIEANYSLQGARAQALVTQAGQILREEGLLGMVSMREPRQTALTEGWGDQPPDLIAVSMVPLEGDLEGARSLRSLRVAVDGGDAAIALVERAHPGFDPADGILELTVVDESDWETAPIPMERDRFGEFLEAEPFIEADHPDIQAVAGRIVDDVLDARSAALAINQWVFENLSKEPVVGVPGALEVLQTRRGDCNEHTALYTALARAVGLPTRIAAGLVFSDNPMLGDGFYYHAWPQVWLGQWVSLDPTFGQAPADATHVPLVYGGLARQTEIAAALGQLRFTLLPDDEATP